jgi:membrane-associated PAP2 superfamily phosphatase
MQLPDRNTMNDIGRVFRSPALLGDPLVQCLALMVVTSAVFLAFPGLDLWFSGLFYAPGNGFVAGQMPLLVALRDLHRNGTTVVVVVLVAALLIKLAWPNRPSLVKPRDIAYILGTLAIASGVIVNLIFKNNWGRPRPFRVIPFGGDQPFVPVWQITDYCSTNCSFVSGEGSSAIWLLTLVVLVPAVWRPTATRIILGLAIALSLNRIAFGGHFLSDVLLAWWMTLAVMAALYKVLYRNPQAALANDALEDGLTQAGLAIRRAGKAAVQALRGKGDGA